MMAHAMMVVKLPAGPVVLNKTSMGPARREMKACANPEHCSKSQILASQLMLQDSTSFDRQCWGKKTNHHTLKAANSLSTRPLQRLQLQRRALMTGMIKATRAA